jgi:nucleoside-diphosphate kinase
MEKMLVLIKPDGVARGLIGRLLSRIEEKGFVVGAMKMLQPDRRLAEELYLPHKGKGFYEPLVAYITSGPIVALVLSGENLITQVRSMMGATDPSKAAPGSIRGDFCVRIEHNIIHGSDSPESAEREIAVFFRQDEILDYKNTAAAWL